MSTPAFTILLPIVRSPAFLEFALQSVAAQTCPGYELFIISDGGSAMRGTPFDKAINADYKKLRRQRSGAKLPFVTTLVARDGVMVQHTVTIGSKPVELPQRPPPQSAEVKAAPENKPANAPVAPPPNVAVKKESEPASVPSAPPSPKVVQIVTKSNNVDAATNSAPPKPIETASAVTNPAWTNGVASTPVVPAASPPPLS